MELNHSVEEKRAQAKGLTVEEYRAELKRKNRVGNLKASISRRELEIAKLKAKLAEQEKILEKEKKELEEEG